MQALPSFTASGEQDLSALPPLSTLPASGPASLRDTEYTRLSEISGVWGRSLDASWPATAVRDVAGIAEGIGLAHDAGNLLGAIRLYCDLLALPGVLRSEHRHYAEELRQLSARSGSLIDRLLRPGSEVVAESWCGAGQPGVQAPARSPHPGLVCPAVVVREYRSLLQAIAGETSLLVSVEAGMERRAAVPQETMERILANLTKNAAEAGGGQGPITVRVRAVAAWGPEGVPAVALSVEDCGRGMSETKVRALLAGDATEEWRPGRGIGLRVVRELVAGTGGELRISSRMGRGTKIEMMWAAVAEEEATPG